MHDGFRQTPPEQVIDDGQSEFVTQLVPQEATGVAVGVGLGVGVAVGVAVGVGVGVGQIQFELVTQLGFLHWPPEQVIDDGQSVLVVQTLPHERTGVGVGVGDGVGVGTGVAVGTSNSSKHDPAFG